MAVRNLIKKELFQMRWILIIGLLFGLALAVITVGTFHYLEQIIGEIPNEIVEIFSNYDMTRELMFIFGDYSLYIWSQWNAKNLYQAGALFAIIIAASQFAGEISRRTIGFYLTRPITRKTAYLAKVIAGILTLFIIFACGTILIWVSSSIMGLSAEWGRLFIALLVSLVWLSAFYLLGTIVSVLNHDPVKAGVIVGICGILLSLPGLFALSRQFSIFYQMRAADYYIYSQPAWPSIGVGLVVNLLLLMVGLLVFTKRDF